METIGRVRRLPFFPRFWSSRDINLKDVGPEHPNSTWVVVKIVKMMVPFGVPIIIRHLLFRVPKKGP